MYTKLQSYSSRLKREIYLGLLAVLFSTAAFAQSTVSGTVTDPSGDTLPGAAVIAEGTTAGSVTDLDGKYSVNVPEGATQLKFSFIGYATQTVDIGSRSTIDVVLQEDAETLSEVVVIGYGTQKKTDLTGAIVGVDSQTITERGTTSPMQSLQGSVAGITVTNSSGRLGDDFNVNIRGSNTLVKEGDSPEPPLFVVNGAVVDNIDFLNPQDIASIDVLKDAASAAIYGSRGSQGVIIIQTKGGVHVPSGTTFSVESFYGFKEAARLPEMMDYATWREYHMGAYLATTSDYDQLTPEEYYDRVASVGSNQVLRNRFESLDGFDWYDAVLKSGMQANNYISMNHRDGGSSYSMGLGYQTETGNIENESLDKYTFRASIDQELSKKFKTGASFSATLTNNERGNANAMQDAFRLNPFLTPWNIDTNLEEIEGEYFPNPGKLLDPNDPSGGTYAINKTSTYNPLLEIANASDETRQWNMLGNIYLQYQIADWIKVKTSLATATKRYRRGKYWGVLTDKGSKNGNLASSEVSTYDNFNYAWDNQLDINKTVGDIHAFNFMALQSIYADRTERSEMSSLQQPFETGFYNVGSGQQSTFNLGNSFSQNQLASYALRLNYMLNNKYIFTVTNRWDGASQLAEGRKWQSFPSVSAAWKISEEAFLSGNPVVSSLKLRASYGTTGSQRVSPYSSVNTLNTQNYYDFNGASANGWVAGSLANKLLGWETTTEVNVGLDYSLMNYRISGSIDWYTRDTDDLILEQTLPLETGYGVIKANNALIRNTGVEVLLKTVNVETAKVRWETTFTFSKNVNTIEELYGQSENDDVGNGWFIGESVNSHYNYKFNGIWQADEADLAELYNQNEGQAKVLDVNGDGVIDPDDDRMILGSSDPKWTAGLNSRLTVGNFDFNINAYANQGVLAYSNFHQNFEDVRDRGRQKLNIDSWYIPQNNVGVPAQASNTYPQPRNAGTYWRNDQVGYYKDASFIKINNISLGYTLPNAMLEKMRIQNLRVYVNVLNPFVFTEYDGWDPEWAEASFGIGRVSTITTQLGLSLKF